MQREHRIKRYTYIILQFGKRTIMIMIHYFWLLLVQMASFKAEVFLFV